MVFNDGKTRIDTKPRNPDKKSWVQLHPDITDGAEMSKQWNSG